jgi:hypothetical protein
MSNIYKAEYSWGEPFKALSHCREFILYQKGLGRNLILVLAVMLEPE